jgi:hypothetical protein
MNSSGKKVIDMDIIDKIKSMRSKSREVNAAFNNNNANPSASQSAYLL